MSTEEMTKDERARQWYGLLDSTGLVYIVVQRGTWRETINGEVMEGERSQVLGISDTYEVALAYMEGRYPPFAMPGQTPTKGEWGISVTDITPMLFWDRTCTTLDVHDAAREAKLQAVDLLRKFAAEFTQAPNARGLTEREIAVSSNAIMFASNLVNGRARGLKRVDGETGASAEVA